MATPGSLAIGQGGYSDLIINRMTSFVVTVTAYDTLGYPMPNEPIVFSLPVSGAGGYFAWSQGRTCTAYTNANGYAQSEQIVANSTVGGWIGLIQFVNAPGISTQIPGMANITDIPYGYRMEFTSGGNQKAATSTAYAAPMVVQCWDQFGQKWPSGLVSFNAPTTYGTFVGGNAGGTASVLTDANGYATSPVFTASATAGAFNVKAYTDAYPRANQEENTTWTNINPAIATGLTLVSGGSQKVPPSTLYPNPLVVRVINGLGQGLSGITVTFTAPGSGASCTFTGTSLTTSAVTAGNGNATTVPNPKSNATLGNFNVVASASGLTSINVPLTCGLNYLPEVCTTLVAATQAITTTPGTTPWLNPNRAFNGNTSGSTLQLVFSEQTQRLFVYDIPADVLAPIHDLAKITKFLVQFEFRRTAGGGSVPQWNHTGSQNQRAMTGVTDNVFVQQNLSFDAQVFPSLVTGASLRSGDYGVSSTNQQQNTPLPRFDVRFVKLAVCYQNPDLPPDPTTILNPLIFCEA